jgi:TPR repeat protein/transglutaminase-like putative cysteine protease
MMKRIVGSVLVWSLAAALAQVATQVATQAATQAAPSPPKREKPVWIDPAWRQTVDHCAVRFDEQGLSVTTCDFEFTASDRKGVEAISQQVFNYNGHFAELVAEDLATVKTDGRLIAVDPRAIHDEAASTDMSSPYFDEQRKRIIAFSDVAPGDRIRGRLIYRDKRARLPGEFARAWYIVPSDPPEVMELTLDGPATKPLRVAARGVEHSEERVGDRIVHHVRFNHDTPQPKQRELDPFDSASRFEASTFADYAALAAMLNARNAPMAAPTAPLQKLAAEIVGDAATTAEKVERLHNWVTERIRYVGVGFEDGGFVSQPAEAVLAARYGDCKAHVTLLKALLATQGIAASFVIVNAGFRYTLTELATPNFDHAIVYVPELDVYLDPTAAKFAFGSLPPQLSGKQVLNLDTGRLSRIPVMTAERHHYGYDIDYVLGADGSREGRAVFSGRGIGAAVERHLAERLDKDRAHAASEVIEGARQEGTGEFTVPDTYALSDAYAATMNFQLARFEIGKRARLQMLALSDPRAKFLSKGAGSNPDQPFVCAPLDYAQTASVALPEKVNISAKPAPVTYTADFAGTTPYGENRGHVEVTGETVIDGRTVRQKAHLLVRFDAPVCPASFAEEIKKAMTKFSDVESASIGVTTKPVAYITETSPDYDAGTKALQQKNYSQAMASLKPLAEAGHPFAQSNLGYLYENGLGVSIDLAEAVRWYRLAADHGDTYSQTRLGYLFERGLGVPRNDWLAAQWYAKSAEAGDEDGQGWLASMYRDGRGVARNYKEAEKWFSLCAEQGSAWALMNIGLLYVHGGDGVPQDNVKAIDFFRRAAEGGDADALYNLGWAYEQGIGVAADRQKAIEWYSKAAGKRQVLAIKRLDSLSEDHGLWWALLHLVGL